MKEEYITIVEHTFDPEDDTTGYPFGKRWGGNVFELTPEVRRNIDRFPDAFRFQLTEAEKSELVAKCDRLEPLKHASAPCWIASKPWKPQTPNRLRYSKPPVGQ